jgi:hypothetical protein
MVALEKTEFNHDLVRRCAFLEPLKRSLTVSLVEMFLYQPTHHFFNLASSMACPRSHPSLHSNTHFPPGGASPRCRRDRLRMRCTSCS